MGRGNVCTTGPYEGLFFIDNGDLRVYRFDSLCDDVPNRLLRDLDYADISSGGWYLDEEGSDNEEDDVLICFCDELQNLCHSFLPPIDKWDTWLDGTRRVLLENRLFYICVEDNEWSLAIELIQRDDDYGQLAGLQKRHYAHYLECMKKALLSRLPSIGIYTGPWTSGIITREEAGLC